MAQNFGGLLPKHFGGLAALHCEIARIKIVGKIKLWQVGCELSNSPTFSTAKVLCYVAIW